MIWAWSSIEKNEKRILFRIAFKFFLNCFLASIIVFLKFRWRNDLIRIWRDWRNWRNSEKHEKVDFFCIIFMLFLLDFSTNISNKLFIVKYDLRYCFWCFNFDVCDELDENVREQAIDAFIILIEWYDDFNIVDVDRKIIEHVDSWRRDDLNAVEFIDVIEKSTETTIKRAICAFVIIINKYNDSVDVVIDLNVIEKIKHEIDKLMWLFSLSTKRCFSVLLWCRRTCSWNLLFNVIIFSQCLHVKILKQFFYTWAKNRDVDENWTAHSKQIWNRDEELIIAWSKLISKIDESERIFVIIVLKSFSEMNLNWFFNHCNAESRKHWKKKLCYVFLLIFNDCFNQMMQKACDINRNVEFVSKIYLHNKIKEVYIFEINDFWFDCLNNNLFNCFFYNDDNCFCFNDCFLWIKLENNIWFDNWFETWFCRRSFKWNWSWKNQFWISWNCYRIWTCDEKNIWLNNNIEFWFDRNRIRVEIDCKLFRFEWFKIDFCSRFKIDDEQTSDLIIDSKIISIEIEIKLKLIVNFSNLNDLKDLLNLILKRDLKLTTTISFVSMTISFKSYSL